MWDSIVPPRTTRQEHPLTAQGESVDFGAQPGLESFTPLCRERTYEDRSFHDYYCNAQTETYTEAALGCRLVESLKPWAESGRAVALDPTALRAKGEARHKKEEDKLARPLTLPSTPRRLGPGVAGTVGFTGGSRTWHGDGGLGVVDPAPGAPHPGQHRRQTTRWLPC